MAYVVVVKVCDGWEYLTHDDGCLRLSNKLFLHNKVEQFTPLTNLSYQIDCFLGLIHFVQFNDVRMV